MDIRYADDSSRSKQLEILTYLNSYFLFSSPRSSAGPVAAYLQSHAPGVVDVAFRIDCLTSVLNRLNRLRLLKGMAELPPPAALAHSNSVSSSIFAKLASVRLQPQLDKWVRVDGWGTLGHTLFLSSESAYKSSPSRNNDTIDHIVLNVPKGELDAATAYYQHLLGLRQQQDFQIDTGSSGLASRVLSDNSKHIYFNINEPTTANSQIQMFIDCNRGAGIQHIALRGSQIVSTVAQLRKRGLNFLPVPSTYFESVLKRLRTDDGAHRLLLREEWQRIVEHQILVDWQAEKHGSLLLQIFTLPILPGSLFFFEFIERRGCVEGFGERNFRALFEAMEEDLKTFSQ
jgi:4-hydroxyphenylpyruvate dioxygenase